VSTSNVRNIDSLVAFHGGLLKLSHHWEKLIQEIRSTIHRADEYFSQSQPAYWRHQLQLAERDLTEAKDSLSQKLASARPADRPAATEARKRVSLAERRLRQCQEKLRLARAITVEISQHCDKLLGPLADIAEQCEVTLPQAAVQLQSLIEQLKAYAEQAEHSGDSP
jgi:hypothetical protein